LADSLERRARFLANAKSGQRSVISISLGELGVTKHSLVYNMLANVFTMPTGSDRYKQSFDNRFHSET